MSIGISAVALLLLAAVTSYRGSVRDQAEWRLLGRTAEMQHFSPLAQINHENVGRLGLNWYADVPTEDGLAGNALVADGAVYQSGALGKAWAHDLRTGKLLWEFDAQVKFGSEGTIVSFWGSRVNRGLALHDNKLFIGTGDCRLIAIDRARGTKIWETAACNKNGYYTITGAPRVGDGKVFIGNASMDTGGSRGYVAAFNAETGRELWRFYTVPGDPAKGFESEAMARASKTWARGYWKTSAGGGSPWDAITYDPVLNLVYFGTDGPVPANPRQRGADRGDELFTNSIVAVDAETGAYRWHYQTTPNDAWNFSAAMHIMIADLPLDEWGGKRRVVMQAPKNGFFYVLDAKSGSLLSAKPIVPLNWASRVDLKTGRPVERPEARYYARADRRATVRPGTIGAHSWQAMAFSLDTGLVYIPASTIATPIEIVDIADGVIGGGTAGSVHVGYSDEIRSASKDSSFGRLIAWDPVAGKQRWSVDMRLPTNGGVLATGGRIVFAGAATGEISAFDAITGRRLWQTPTGSAIQAAPTTVDVDGRQVLLVPVGAGSSLNKMLPAYTVTPESRGPARLLAFSLDGSVDLPTNARALAFEKPPLPRFAPGLVRQGKLLFEQRGCDVCHGENAIGGYGSVPDLRRMDSKAHALFGAIVVGGLRRANGMPAFNGDVTMTELETLQAFIIDQAWDAHEKHKPAARTRN